MEQTIGILLTIHAIAGGSSLLAGIGAIFTKKGAKKHKGFGNVYFWSMLVVVVTGLIVGIYRGNLFIQTIAVFSFYMVFTGKRVLRYKKEVSPEILDWGFNIFSMVVAFFMLGFGGYIFSKVGFAGAVPMLWVFGGLLLGMVLNDFKKMKSRKQEKNAWLFDHISRMGGSYIATTTAFLVINVRFQPEWIIWLLPTAIGTPILVRTSRKWRKKLLGTATVN